jgi:hypothetical protein
VREHPCRSFTPSSCMQTIGGGIKLRHEWFDKHLRLQRAMSVPGRWSPDATKKVVVLTEKPNSSHVFGHTRDELHGILCGSIVTRRPEAKIRCSQRPHDHNVGRHSSKSKGAANFPAAPLFRIGGGEIHQNSCLAHTAAANLEGQSSQQLTV